MKLNKYIVLSLLLFMCHRLNWVHCSDIEKGSSSETVPRIPGSSSIDNPKKVGNTVHETQTKDELSTKSTCLETDGNCNESKKGGEKSSEYIPNYKEKSSRSQTELDEHGIKNIDSSHVNVFSNYDRTMKGYLTKTDIGAFLQYKRGNSKTKLSSLETNLFITAIDTDLDGKISLREYSYAISGHIKNLMTTTFDRLRSEKIECIFEEDLELLSDNVEFDFLLLDTNNDDCFSIEEFQDFFNRVGLDPRKISIKISENIPKSKIDEERADVKVAADDSNISDIMGEKNNDNNFDDDFEFAELLDFSDIKEERTYSTIEEAVSALWESIDENDDGHLSQEELVADLSWYGFEAADKVAVPLFSLMDNNMDGMVSSEELISFFKNPPTKNEKIKEWMDTFWDETSHVQNEVHDGPPEFSQRKWTSSLAFIIFDKNKSGYIEWNELKQAMESHRTFHSDALADSVTEYIDIDKDGRISLAEFANAIYSSGHHIEVEYVDEFGNTVEAPSGISNFTTGLAAAFGNIDENKDGFIISKELKHFLELRMQMLTNDDLEDVFAALDVNKNGLITLSDVQTFLTFSSKKISDKEEIGIEAFKQIVKGILKESVTDEEVSAQYSALDVNKDNLISSSEFHILVVIYGMIDESDFITWIEEARFREQREKADSEFNEAFEFFDTDRNEFIDKEELWATLTKLKNYYLKPSEIDEYFVRLDMNGDDLISMDEFSMLLWDKND